MAWIAADGLAVVGRELESTQVKVGDKLLVATVNVQGRGGSVRVS